MAAHRRRSTTRWRSSNKGYCPLPPPRARRRRHRPDARRAGPPRPPRPLARLGPDAPRRRRQHRLLRAHRRGGVLRGALLRHGAARARPRAARVARRPLLVQHLGPAAAALLLPLRRGGGRRPSATRSRCRASRSPRCRRRSPHDAAGLHRPPHPARPGEPGPAAAVALRRRLPGRRLLGRPGAPPRPCSPRASSRTRTPAAAPPCSPTGSRARRRATSCSTPRARTTASSTSWSTRCWTGRRSRPARSSGSTRTSRWRAAGSRASRRSSARCG